MDPCPGSPDLNSDIVLHAKMVFCNSVQGHVKANIAYYSLTARALRKGVKMRGR